MSVSCDFCGKGGFLNEGEMVGHMNMHAAEIQLKAANVLADIETAKAARLNAVGECNCSLRTRLVGDGCEKCNPAQTIEYLRELIAELEAKNASLEAKLESIKALNSVPVRP